MGCPQATQPTGVTFASRGGGFATAASGAGAGFAHAVAVTVGDDDGGVVQQPVQQAGGGDVFGEKPPPRFERPVGADPEGTSFIGGGDEPEQQLRAGVVGGCPGSRGS